MSGLRKLWRSWKQIGKRIADIQVRVLFAIFYFLALGPFALAIAWFGDPLAIKPDAPRGWRKKGDPQGSPTERALRQF